MKKQETKSEPIRILVVDDSPTARQALTALLQSAADIEVVGVGKDGPDCIRLVHRLHPDLVLLDVNMPGLDGLQVTRVLMRELPTPIVLITATLMRRDMDLGFEAVQAGALTVLKKPDLNDAAACESVIQTVRALSSVPVVRRWTLKQERVDPVLPATSRGKQLGIARIRVIGIAASTGGPAALATLLGALPVDFPAPILIVQHVTRGFSIGLANWLNEKTPLSVGVASQGVMPVRGTVWLAPDDRHLELSTTGALHLSDAPPFKGLRPSANYLFESLAKVHGPRASGVMLTGMGDDGVVGLQVLHDVGGTTFAQEAESCVVCGMPCEALRQGIVDQVMGLEQIAQALRRVAVSL